MWATKKQTDRSGFTIVELLVVIVVIAILASITVVAFTGISERARDTVRRSDLAKIANTMNIAEVDGGLNMFGSGSGCGAGGEGSGWWHSTEATYPKSIRQCLVDAGYTSLNSMLDPSGCSGGGQIAIDEDCAGKPRYLVLHCQKNAAPVLYLLAHLETEPENSTFTDDICDPGTSTGFPTVVNWDTSYHVNYLVRVR